MKYATICSGIGAPECAWTPLGWRCSFSAEIEPFPSAVLKHHFPDPPNYGDITKFKEWSGDHSIDVLVGGTPCQSFSVAGLRKGMADPRGNLALVFLAIAQRYTPTWLLWENVPGVLSDQGNAFGSFLGGLAQLGYGFAYRVLDAQYYGVAQRRRRVFVVGHSGGQWQRAAAVLFERESLCGNPPPGREAGQRSAPTISARTKGGGGLGTDAELDGAVMAVSTSGQGYWREGIGPLRAREQDSHENLLTLPQRGGLPEIAYALQERDAKGPDSSTKEGHLIPVRQGGFFDEPLPFDTTQVTSKANRSSPRPGDPMHPLAEGAHPPAIAFQPRIARNGRGDMGDKVNALQAQSGQSGKGDAAPCIAVANPLRSNYRNNSNPTTEAGMHINTGYAVRRLTPTECERLQGFPDGWTAITYNGKPAADGPRYRALGNSMAVPVIRWLGERIQQVHDICTHDNGKT